MNYFTVFLSIGLLFYVTSYFFETWLGHSDLPLATSRYYVFLTTLGCVICLFLDPAQFVFPLAVLLLLTLFPYRQERAFFRLAGSYTAGVILCLLLIVLADWKALDWYKQSLCFLLLFGIYAAILLRLSHKNGANSYYTVTALLLELLMLLRFVWVKEMDPIHLETMLPFLFYLWIIAYDRYCYRLRRHQENILTLTSRRHMDKENLAQYERLQKDNDEILRQMHDLRKQLRLLSKNQEDEELRDRLMDQAEQVLFSGKSGCLLLNRVLANYQKAMLRLHIQLVIDVEPFDESMYDPVDLSAIFCNMLENAIESCERCEDRILQLKIRKEAGYLFIKMKNSCQEVHQVGESFQSMKEDALYHGYGLRNISELAHKYQGDLHVVFDREHHLFLTNLHLRLPLVSEFTPQSSSCSAN